MNKSSYVYRVEILNRYGANQDTLHVVAFDASTAAAKAAKFAAKTYDATTAPYSVHSVLSYGVVNIF